jgi:predicted  nucleic acid-binding Zn-ribbon protein
MHGIMAALVELQKLETGPEADSPPRRAVAQQLRGQIPAQILGHYDRLRARGRKGLALVRHHVCAECHVSVPVGTVVTVMKGLDIQLCGNCGRYLYVEPEPPAPEPPLAIPKAKRGRKPKQKPDPRP